MFSNEYFTHNLKKHFTTLSLWNTNILIWKYIITHYENLLKKKKNKQKPNKTKPKHSPTVASAMGRQQDSLLNTILLQTLQVPEELDFEVCFSYYS